MAGMENSAYDPAAWESFAVAQLGAAAALAGLLVVASSINITRIIHLPAIVSRLAATLVLFGAVLIVATLVLVPGQPALWLGLELFVVGAMTAALVLRLRGTRTSVARYRVYALAIATVGVTASVLIAVGGITLTVERFGGLYWLVPGTLLAFAVGLGNAWVALIEILR
jgi:hypothetical protein